jgi:hypothetical protein
MVYDFSSRYTLLRTCTFAFGDTQFLLEIFFFHHHFVSGRGNTAMMARDLPFHWLTEAGSLGCLSECGALSVKTTKINV